MSDPIIYHFGTVFPPRNEWEVEAYDNDETLAGFSDGYREKDRAELLPGGNRSASYRWGWQNSIRDHSGKDDGFDHVRQAFIRMRRNAA